MEEEMTLEQATLRLNDLVADLTEAGCMLDAEAVGFALHIMNALLSVDTVAQTE